MVKYIYYVLIVEGLSCGACCLLAMLRNLLARLLVARWPCIHAGNGPICNAFKISLRHRVRGDRRLFEDRQRTRENSEETDWKRRLIFAGLMNQARAFITRRLQMDLHEAYSAEKALSTTWSSRVATDQCSNGLDLLALLCWRPMVSDLPKWRNGLGFFVFGQAE